MLVCMMKYGKRLRYFYPLDLLALWGMQGHTNMYVH